MCIVHVSHQAGMDLVGRENDFACLQDAWECNNYRVFVLHGPKLVGKSSFVREFLSWLKQSAKYKILTFNYTNIQGLRDFEDELFDNSVFAFNHESCESKEGSRCRECYRKLSRAVNSMDTVVLWFDHLEEATQYSEKSGTPKAARESLYDLIVRLYIYDLLMECTNVRIVISSTHKFEFARVKFWSHRLRQLDDDAAGALLRGESGSSDVDPNLGITKLCAGLPLALKLAGKLYN